MMTQEITECKAYLSANTKPLDGGVGKPLDPHKTNGKTNTEDQPQGRGRDGGSAVVTPTETQQTARQAANGNGSEPGLCRPHGRRWPSPRRGWEICGAGCERADPWVSDEDEPAGGATGTDGPHPG